MSAIQEEKQDLIKQIELKDEQLKNKEQEIENKDQQIKDWKRKVEKMRGNFTI